MSNEQWLRNIQTDPRPTDELIQLALSKDEEEDTYWEALWVLHARGTREVLEAAQALCRSTVRNERRVGVNILGKLGDSARMLREARAALADPETKGTARKHYADIVQQLAEVIGEAREFPVEAASALLELCSVEEDEGVLQSMVFALGHYTENNHVIEALVRLAEHHDDRIRYAVAMSLHDVDTPLAVTTLIHLTMDCDRDVRDWATFGLAQFIETDNAEIRDALAARLTDEDDDVYSEGVYGLARRGDPRVIPELLAPRELTGTSDYTFLALISAGKLIGDPRLLPLLLEEKARWDAATIDNETDAELYQDLLTAIARCTQGR